MPHSPKDPKSGRVSRSALLLALGATTGLALAAWGLLENPASARLPENAVARVNNTLIRSRDFERLVAVVVREMRTPDERVARKRVLDRMIEEELLIQRAVDLGLIHLDRKVRADLTSSVIASVVNDVKDVEPTADELEAFFADNKEYFTRPGRVRARQILFRVSAVAAKAGKTSETHPAEERAEQARARLLAGDEFQAVKAELGDSEISKIPNAMLPAAKLREYVGPTLLRSILALEIGAWSEPVRSGAGIHLVQLIEREPAKTPPLPEIRQQVTSDWRRRQGDRALRDYLDELRARAKIEITPDFE